jgi:sip
MTKQTFKLRKLRTGKFVTAVAGIILAGTMMASKADAAVAGYDTVATPDTPWEARTVEQVKAEIGDFSSPYVIKWGDTLGVIAQASGIDMNKIAADNGIADVNLIYTGNVLYAKDGYTAVGNVQTGEVKVYQEVEKTPAANTPAAIQQVQGQKVQEDVSNSQDQKVQEIKKEVQKQLDHGRETQVQPQQQGEPSSTVIGSEETPAQKVEQPAEKPATTTTANAEKPADTTKPTDTAKPAEEKPATPVAPVYERPAIRKDTIKTVTPIKHGIIERTDATLDKGVRKVIQNGVDGSITKVITTVYENGRMKSSTAVSEHVVDAIDEIVLVGTKEADATPASPEKPVEPTTTTTTTEAPKPEAPVVKPVEPTTTTTTTEAPKPVEEKPAEKPVEPTTTTTTTEAPKPVEVKTKETRKVRDLTIETETINDDTLPVGQEVVVNNGKAGYVEQDFEITTVNGVKKSETKVGAERTVAGTKRVVRKGTGTKANFSRSNENTKRYATLEALNKATDAELSAIKKGDLEFKSTSKTKNVEEAKAITKYGNEHLDVLKVNDEFARLMNAERAKKGVKPIAVDAELVRLAGIRSAELANQAGGASIYVNGKAHVRLDGSSFSTVYKDYKGERLAFKGENLLGNIEVITDAKNFLNETQVAKMMYEQWAASPGHYANMMSDSFTKFGVDIEYGATSQGYGSYSGMSGVGTTLFGGGFK